MTNGIIGMKENEAMEKLFAKPSKRLILNGISHLSGWHYQFILRAVLLRFTFSAFLRMFLFCNVFNQANDITQRKSRMINTNSNEMHYNRIVSVHFIHFQ